MLTLLLTFVLALGFTSLGTLGSLMAFNVRLRKRTLSWIGKNLTNISLLDDEEVQRGFREGMLLAVALLLMLIFLPLGLLMLVSAAIQAIHAVEG
jgi:hypothetical protein